MRRRFPRGSYAFSDEDGVVYQICGGGDGWFTTVCLSDDWAFGMTSSWTMYMLPKRTPGGARELAKALLAEVRE
jgi:hypothetical protein